MLLDGMIEYVYDYELHSCTATPATPATQATSETKNPTILPAQPSDSHTPKQLVLSNASNRSCNLLGNSSCGSFVIGPIVGQMAFTSCSGR